MKPVRRLSLRRESLTPLDHSDLHAIAGAGSLPLDHPLQELQQVNTKYFCVTGDCTTGLC